MNDEHNTFSIEFLRKHWKGFIIPIIFTYIITKLLDTLLNVAKNKIPLLGSQISYAIYSYLVPKISSNSQQTAALFTLYILTIAISIGLCHVFSSFQRTSRYNKEKTIQLIKQLEDPDQDSDSISEIIEEPHIQDKKSILNQLKKSLKVNFILKMIFNTLCILGFIDILIIYAEISLSSEQATRLTNNIEIVSPYISDLEYKQLKSDFYTMETYEDYSLLVNSLNEIAEDHSLKLK